MQTITLISIAVTAVLFCIWLLKPLAIQIGFVDKPGGRKWHEHEVPLIGGVAMFFGFFFAVFDLHLSLYSYHGLLAGSALVMLIGVVDDFRELSTRTRLIVQAVAGCLLIIWGQISIKNIGNILFLGNISLGTWAFPLTVLAVVAYINAMNMLDGQDGLAGSVALGQVLLFMGIAFGLGRLADFYFLMIVASILIVFLIFNMPMPWRKHASIYMGDSGVTFLAYLICWFAIDLSQIQSMMVKPITILWILSFPLFDLICVTIHRLQQKKSPLMAGRDHLHHILQNRGLSKTLSTILLAVMSLLLGLIGLFFNWVQINEGWQFMCWVGLLIGYLCYDR